MVKKQAKPQRKTKAASSPEAREKQMVALAIDLAEQQLLEGTASSQVITHFLKSGSTKEQVENELKIEQRNHLKAKTEAIASAQASEEIYKEALKAMSEYSGLNQGVYDE